MTSFDNEFKVQRLYAINYNQMLHLTARLKIHAC